VTNSPPYQATHDISRTRVGIVGTGFIASGLASLLGGTPDLILRKVLTHRPFETIDHINPAVLTREVDDLVDSCDLIVECSGDIHRACEVVARAFQKGLPVVTMGTEFHVTAGSYFATQGMLTEAEGDQPGCLAALHEEVVSMGFRPLVYGNIKGFLNHTPTEEDMRYWSQRNGISLAAVTSFTDGTKLQLEQVLIGNGMGAGLTQRGMTGLKDLPLLESGHALGAKAREYGGPIADWVLNPTLPAGVFVVGDHPSARPEVLRYLKLGDGPYYTLLRPYHLCHFEIPRTIRRVLRGDGALLNNGAIPTLQGVAVAKRDLPAGTRLENPIGGWDVRGEAVRIDEEPDTPPIGLLDGAILRHSIAPGQTIRLSDVDLPDSLAKQAWEHVRLQATA
jgi:predicted homoserine dehydrogenase-like protein